MKPYKKKKASEFLNIILILQNVKYIYIHINIKYYMFYYILYYNKGT